MSRTESTFSQRIGARISPELKARLQRLVEDGNFESEADTVREALWHYVEQIDGQPRPHAATNATGGELQSFEQRIEWLFGVVIILLAMVGSRILQTLGAEKIKPAALVDEAIQETIYNQTLLQERLQIGQEMAQHNQPEEIDTPPHSG